MGHITATDRIAAPLTAVFAYVDDHRNTTTYMKDLTKWARLAPTRTVRVPSSRWR